MPVIPLDVDDEVLYTIRKVYLSRDTSVTVQTRLDFWGTVFFNGSPIANIGAIPMSTQAQAEAGVDNTTVMSPLRTKQAVTVQAFPAVIAGSGGGTTAYLRADGTWSIPAGGGGGVTDGDKGDIVVSGSGAVWMFDTAVVTAAAKTVLDDTTVAAMLATLGALPLAGGTMSGSIILPTGLVLQCDTSGTLGLSVPGAGGQVRFITNSSTRANFNDAGLSMGVGTAITLAADPSAALHAATKQYVDAQDALTVPVARTISTTAPLTGGGDLSANRTLDISTFTASVKGAVPPPTTATGKYLKDDGTWATPAGGSSLRTINSYSGTSLTAVTGDAGAYVRCTGTNPTYTLPPNSSVALAVGTQIDGVGTATAMTLIAGAGVTINKPRTLVTLAADSGWTAIKVLTDEWDLHGDFV